MDIRVLGPMEVRVDGEAVGLGGPRQRALLALLVAAATKPVSADVLIEGIWGEEASFGARSTLQTHVSNLRHLLGDVIVHDRGLYRLDVDPASIDAMRFGRILDESRAAVAIDAAGTAVRLREALALWRGRPYADLVDVPGMDAEVRWLEERRLEAVELRIDAELATGRHGTLIAELQALAEEHPLRERFRAQHMLALYRSGRQSEALRAYRRAEEYLAGELGVEPSRELREMELAILEHDESLLLESRRPVTQRLAFLITEIEGSDRMWDRSPQAMSAALAVHDRLVRKEVEAAGGRVFKHTGDGVATVLPGTSSAVEAAEAVQRGLAATDWGEVGDLRVRMGIDVGEAESRGGDFSGPPLNRASWLCAIAHGGQVLLSAAAQAEAVASATVGLQIRQLGEVRLRGMVAPEPVAQLVLAGLPSEFPELRVEAEAHSGLELLSLPGYEVRNRLGEGSLGVVWRAYQPSVGREVAIKMIRPELASRPSFVRRFEAEARTIARLAHPHIVPLIDFWRDTEHAYLVMGLMPGGPLSASLAAGAVERRTARRILAQVGSALDHGHSMGLVHGDLRPESILLDGAGNAYLTDFGIAGRLVDPDRLGSAASLSELRPPEHVITGPSPHADRYSLGVLARRLLGDDPDLSAVLARATAVEPEQRYPTAAAFLAELDEALGEEPIEGDQSLLLRNPFKGLRAFDESDAADFHGRSDLVATLVAAVAEHRFVTVVGPSGSGKSSVVRAGLLPGLATGTVAGSADWAVAVFTPGSDPMAAMAEALARVSAAPVSTDDLEVTGPAGGIDGDLVLVVDQFEEVYTLVDDPERRRRFLDLLIAAAEDEESRVRVVATLRADFYDRPLEDPRFGRLVRDGLVTVLPPTHGELVEMITAPSRAVGLRWEQRLPERIAEEVAHQAGGLPLLQFALTELVDGRSADLLTAADYDRVGGVSGALIARAEELYLDLTAARQKAARQALVRMVTVDEELGNTTRRRVRRTELESIGIPRSDLDAVLDEFVSQRLFLASHDPATRGPTVEVAHEALLQEWPRLSGWLDEVREGLVLGRRFRSALRDWDGNDHHDDYLLTGNRLAPYAEWAETFQLTPEERTFYQASRDRDRSRRLARRRRRRTLAGILTGATVIAITLSSIAVTQARRATTEAENARAEAERAALAEELAETERDRALAAQQQAEAAQQQAEADRDRARASELSAFATVALDFDPSLAKLLAVASHQTWSDLSLETILVLRRALADDPKITRYAWPEDRDVGFLWTHLSPDGTRLVAAACGCFPPSTYLEVYDLVEERMLWDFEVDNWNMFIDSPRFSPTGETVVAGLWWFGENKPSESRAQSLGVYIWDAETGETLQRFDDHDLGPCGAYVGGVSETHLVVATIRDDAAGCFHWEMVENPVVELIDIDSGERRVLAAEGDLIAMSGDGRYVVFSDYGFTPGKWVVEEVATGQRVLELDIEYETDHGLALNHDGSLLVTPTLRELRVWDVAAGEMIGTFDGHTAGAWAAVFSALDDDTVFSVGRSGSLLQWDARTLEKIDSYPAVGNGWISVAETGLVAITDMEARSASLIQTGGRGGIWAVDTAIGSCFAMAASLGAGGGLATFSDRCEAADEQTTVVVDLANRRVAGKMEAARGQASRISPDGSRLVRAEAEERPLATGRERWIGPLRIRDAWTHEVLTEFQGICTWDGAAFGDPALREGCARYPETPFPMHSLDLSWSPDGSSVAVLSQFQPMVSVWDTDSGALISAYDGCRQRRGFAGLYYDGSEIVFFCDDPTDLRIVVVDAATGDEIQSAPVQRLGAEALAIVGYTPETPDGRFLVATRGFWSAGGGSLLWLDETLEVVHELPRIHEGSPRSYAMSPSGRLLATGSAEGFVRVWDLVDRRQVDEIYIGDLEIPGVLFLDEARLAVLPQNGHFQVHTLDLAELIDLVRGSLTRGFTETECQRYGFGEACPTLEDLSTETLGPRFHLPLRP